MDNKLTDEKKIKSRAFRFFFKGSHGKIRQEIKMKRWNYDYIFNDYK